MGRRLAIVFAIVMVSVFAVGFVLFNWYVSSDSFNRRLEGLRGRLKSRGIQLGAMRVGRLGDIEITDLTIDLGGTLGSISVGRLTGRVEVLSLLRGKVRTTFDVSELVAGFLSRRFQDRFRLNPSAKVAFSFEGDPRRLESTEDLSGEIALDDVVLTDTRSGLDVRVSSARCPVSAPGPVVSFADVPVRFVERDFRLRGSIRSLLRAPEFVDTVLDTSAQELRETAKRIIDSFNDAEVSRKVGMKGLADLRLKVDGPILSPGVVVEFALPSYELQFRGEFRQILTTFQGVRGTATWSWDEGRHPRVEATVQSGAAVFDYSELARSHLPHLYFRASEGYTKITYGGERLVFEPLNLKAYGGALSMRMNIDLNRKPVQFDWKSVIHRFDVNALLADAAALPGFLGGTMSVLFEGESMTLMLERVIAEGKVRIEGARLVGLPKSADLALPVVRRSLPGATFGDATFDVKLDHGFLEAMRMRFQGPNGAMTGSVHYDILTLDTRAAFGFDLTPGFLAATPGLARELPDGRLDLTLEGRIVEPIVQYTPSVASPGP